MKQSEDTHTIELSPGNASSHFEILLEANPRHEMNGRAEKKNQSCTDLNCKIISKNWVII